jgi:hypothetical protein
MVTDETIVKIWPSELINILTLNISFTKNELSNSRTEKEEEKKWSAIESIFGPQRNAHNPTSKIVLALLSWLSIKKLRHCFQITRTHMSSLMHFFAKDNCHFHSFDHSLELCLAAKISNHKRAKFLKTQHFLNFQWFKCTTRFTFSALILVSLQKALT